MKIERFDVPGPVLITPARFGDARGWFSESWSAARLAEQGLGCDFVQDNHAFSGPAGVLRGLHCQTPPFAQTKLVRCSRGRIFDVAVDARRGSPTLGRWVGVELDADAGAQLLVPRGFLHGYLTLEPDCEVQYKVDAVYARDHDRGVAWDDPDLAIAWPLAAAGVSAPALSAKDAAQPTFAAFDSPFVHEATP